MQLIIMLVMIGAFFGICLMVFLTKSSKGDGFDEIANRPLEDESLIDNAEQKEENNE